MADVFTVAGNRLQLLTQGAERLDTLIALIESARTSLKLFYYMYVEDDAGRRVHNALMDATIRGVSVALIVDGFGSDTSGDTPFFSALRECGVDLCVFHPRLGRRYLLRNHQKFAIADGQHAIIGGFNVASAYFDNSHDGWRDLGMSLKGPLAQQLSDYFDIVHQWTAVQPNRMRDLRAKLQSFEHPQGAVQMLIGGPMRTGSPLARTLKADLAQGRQLAIITAYFSPDPAMLRRLDRIGLKGDSQIITASRSDNSTTIGAARWTYAGLLRKGVRIFEYQPMKLHTKLVVIDDTVYLGSANFDMRSLYINMEIMLRVNDTAFAAHVKRYVKGEITASREIRFGDVRGWRIIPAKIRWALSYFLVTVLDYRVARRLNLDA